MSNWLERSEWFEWLDWLNMITVRDGHVVPAVSSDSIWSVSSGNGCAVVDDSHVGAGSKVVVEPVVVHRKRHIDNTEVGCYESDE